VLLAVDVGNSQTVIGLFDGDLLHRHWRLSTDPRRTSDELALLVGGLLAFERISFASTVDGLVVCSVVPVVTERLREMAATYVRAETVVVEPGTRTGIPIRMDNPREVGADRLVNGLAAFELVGGPAIVVDFGTATSFDVVSAKGEFIGGAIAPGVQTSMSALSDRGAQLPTVELLEARRAIGRNTIEAMQSGAVYGFAGQVDRIVEMLGAELPSQPTVVATGGLAGAIVRNCRTIDRHEPWLTLLGLRHVWERNT